MEGLVRLVTESLKRHGLVTPPPRLDWSPWTPLDFSLSFSAPSGPGVFLVAERVAPHGLAAGGAAEPQFAVFHEGQSHDLGFEMGLLCSPHNPLRDRIANGSCWVRYAATPEPVPAESRQPIADSLTPAPLPSGF